MGAPRGARRGVSPVLPGADVRGCYSALGIELPARAQREAAVACFVAPEAHVAGDRHASTSVSLVNGSFCCHGCGARGGAYDAALALGYTPRDAIDVMVRFALTERRQERSGGRSRSAPPRAARRQAQVDPPVLEVVPADLADAHQALLADTARLNQLERDRAITRATIERFALGWDRGRLVVPVRGPDGRLVAVRRYNPNPRRRGPKLLAARGSRRSLFPPPELLADPLVLCEGEPDALAGLSHGLNATSVFGTHAWDPLWAPRFTGRPVTICVDCDAEGRALAARMHRDLTAAGAIVGILDLADDRDDGFDLADLLREQPPGPRRREHAENLARALAAALATAAAP